MNIFRFENPEYLYGLLIVPVLVVFFIFVIRNKTKAIEKYGNKKLLLPLIPGYSTARLWTKFIILSFALTSLLIAIANPQIGSKIEKSKRQGIDLMIAVDISNSMLAEDIKPNRLDRSKKAISKLVDRLEGDRLGIIVFAGKAYTQLPITTDYSAAKLFLSTINTDYINTQGTSIAAAIELAINSFGNKEESETSSDKNKAIIVITDGEDHEEGAIDQAKLASEQGIMVYTIGMGEPKGPPIPLYANGRKTGHKKDQQGNTIMTKLNEPVLREIAEAGNGIYVRANNTQTGLNKIFTEINALDKSEIETRVFKEYEDRFQILIAITILLLLIEFIIFEKKNISLENLKIFK